jgi:hypothetical protein
MKAAMQEVVVIRTKTKWVDIPEAKRTLALPDPWPELESQAFHPDLVDRAYAHLAYAVRYGEETAECNARVVLAIMGRGFTVHFDRSRFEPKPNDPNYELKTKALDAIDELAAFYGDRVSTVMWKSFACLACRENPEEERSIVKEGAAGTLPYHYTVVDSALHAAGLVYTFMLHVNSVMFRHTKRILVHNCDCNHSLVNVEEIGGSVDYTLPRANIKGATQSVFTHFLAETVKLIECFLPFAYSITPEAREIQELL